MHRSSFASMDQYDFEFSSYLAIWSSVKSSWKSQGMKPSIHSMCKLFLLLKFCTSFSGHAALTGLSKSRCASRRELEDYYDKNPSFLCLHQAYAFAFQSFASVVTGENDFEKLAAGNVTMQPLRWFANPLTPFFTTDISKTDISILWNRLRWDVHFSFADDPPSSLFIPSHDFLKCLQLSWVRWEFLHYMQIGHIFLLSIGSLMCL